jgi:hypothetical protein
LVQQPLREAKVPFTVPYTGVGGDVTNVASHTGPPFVQLSVVVEMNAYCPACGTLTDPFENPLGPYKQSVSGYPGAGQLVVPAEMLTVQALPFCLETNAP